MCVNVDIRIHAWGGDGHIKYLDSRLRFKILLSRYDFNDEI